MNLPTCLFLLLLWVTFNLCFPIIHVQVGNDTSLQRLGVLKRTGSERGQVHSEACPETEAWGSAALCGTLLIGPGFPMKSLAVGGGRERRGARAAMTFCL